MPSQDTWSSLVGLKQTSYQGRIRTWVNTPNFGSLPKDSKPVNRYDDTNRRYSQSSYAAWNVRKSDGLISYVVPNGPYYTGQGLADLEHSLIELNDPQCTLSIFRNENGCLVKALGKISDAKVNVAVAYAEAAKTSDLILQTANRIDRAYRALRRGRFKEVARLLNLSPKTVHKTWLEYKYGWTPLLMDVKNAAEFFAQQHVGRPVRFVVSASEQESGSKNWIQTYWPYDDNQESLAQIFHSSVWESKAKVKIWCELTNPSYSQLQQIGLTNPLLVAWELVPYSFVFDWFISVGDWLQGLTALNGVTVRRIMMTSYVDRTYGRNTPPTVRSSATHTYHEGGMTLSLNRKIFGRGAPSVDPLSLYPPKAKSFSFQKMITSLALLRGQYRGPARV